MELKNIEYKYKQTKENRIAALKKINAKIDENKITGIVGSSGSGKSTLLQILNTLLKPSSGEYKIDDLVIFKGSKTKNLINIKKRNALVFQFSSVQFFEKTIEEDFKFTFKNFNLDYEQHQKDLSSLLKQFELDKDVLKQHPQTLSGGEKKKLAIISALLTKPKMLLLDEPTIGIDIEFKTELLNILRNKNILGLGIIISSHDIDFLNEISNNIINIEKGNLKYIGTLDEYIHKQYNENNIEELPEIYKYAKKLNMPYIKDLKIENIVSKIESRLKEKNV